MSTTTSVISPLRQRMIEDMRMRKLAPKTQTGYIRAVRHFAGYLGRSPDQASAEDLRRYQLHCVDRGVSPITLNATITGLRFFFEVTLGRAELMAKMRPVPVAQTLPVAQPAANPLAVVTIAGAAGNADLRFSYLQPSNVTQAGFQRNAGAGTIRMLIGGNWQDLTDPNALNITTFDVVPDAGPTAPLRLPCPRLCPDGTENCWPTLQVRELQVTIAGQARSDPAVAHQVTTRVRLRNDALAFNGGAGAGVCP